MLLLGSRLVKVAIGRHTGREKDIRKSVGNHSVHFFGHIHVERTDTCHQVGDFYTFLTSHDGTGHGRSEVVDHHDQICRMVVQFFGECNDDACQSLEEIIAFHIQIGVRTRHVQILE